LRSFIGLRDVEGTEEGGKVKEVEEAKHPEGGENPSAAECGAFGEGQGVLSSF
jgi:hypothetical protein